MTVSTWITVSETPPLETYVTATYYAESGVFDYAGSHCTYGQPGTYDGGTIYTLQSLDYDKTNHTREETELIDKHLQNLISLPQRKQSLLFN